MDFKDALEDMTMSSRTKVARQIAGFAIAAAAIAVPVGAQAQYYAAAYPQPLYPYVVQQQPSYVVVQPQAYAPRAYPYVNPGNAPIAARAAAPRILHRDRAPVSKTDPALVEELRRRGRKVGKVIVVREKPVVIEHKRIVDDPPIVVQREKIIEEDHIKMHDRPSKGGPRVIRAEAEVTILGPDRMNIRLFRRGAEPLASAEPAKPRSAPARDGAQD
jgi:hypothetical protein